MALALESEHPSIGVAADLAGPRSGASSTRPGGTSRPQVRGRSLWRHSSGTACPWSPPPGIKHLLWPAPRAGVTYDTGALIAGDRNNRQMWARHVGFIAEEVVPTVPAPVVAEAWRGGPRQASLARMRAGCEIEEMSAGQARRVGELAGRADHDDVVDAVSSKARHDVKMTSSSRRTNLTSARSSRRRASAFASRTSEICVQS